MKSAIAFALVCIAASCSAAVITAPDYAAVNRKVMGIRTIVQSGLCQVKTIANSDNPTVGRAIEAQLDEASDKANVIFVQAHVGIIGQNLTVTEAQALFGELKNILAGLQADLQDELAQLSNSAADQIRDIFYSSYATVEQTAQEIYALLAATSSINAVDYPAVGRKVEEVRVVVSNAVNQIKNIANDDNSAVGGSIGSQLDVAAGKATVILERAQAAVQAQTLTVSQAEGLFGELKDILAGVQGDLQDELAQLSSSASGRIRDLFYSAYAQAETIAQQVYALLSA